MFWLIEACYVLCAACTLMLLICLYLLSFLYSLNSIILYSAVLGHDSLSTRV